MLASGSGAASRGIMGTAIVFGMTITTLIGIFLIPVCHVFVQVSPSGGGKSRRMLQPHHPSLLRSLFSGGNHIDTIRLTRQASRRGASIFNVK